MLISVKEKSEHLSFDIPQLFLNQSVIQISGQPKHKLPLMGDKGRVDLREGCTNQNPEKVWSFAKLPSDPPP